MDEKDRSGSEGPVVHADDNGRRQVLKLLAAGTVGGAIGVGLDRLVGEDEDRNERIVVRSDGDSRSYDVVLHERDDGYEALDTAGDTIHSGSDGWAVLENSIQAVPEAGSIFVSGRYAGTSTIQVSKSIRVDGHEAVIDQQETGDFAFRFEGEERHQTTLAEAAATGDNTVTLDDTSGIQGGDMVLLEEEDGEPVLGREQPPGEPHSALEVDGGTVRLEDSIVWRDGYPQGTLVYVIDPIQVHVSGFSLTSPRKDENYYGVTAHKCRNSTFEDLRLEKFGSRGIMLQACANSRVRDCTVLQSSDIEASDGYGIQVWAGCHDIIVEGCVAKECRHPLSVTPGGDREVASRSIIFRDCFVTSNGSAALNCHGGAAHDVRFEGCTVHTWGEAGVRTGAQETNVSGCEFRMNSHHAIDTRNDGQEMILTVTDTDVFGAGSAVHLDREDNFEFEPVWKLVHVDGVRAYGCNRFFELEDGAVDRVRDLIIRGCYWDEVAEEGLRVRNRIDGGVIEGNNFGAAPGGSHIRVFDSPDSDVNNVHVLGNRFRQPSGTDPFIQLSHSENCVVTDNIFRSGSNVNIFVEDTNSTANIVKQNTYFAPDASADPIDINEGSVEMANYVYDTNAERWL